jgi:hypothetical protein
MRAHLDPADEAGPFKYKVGRNPDLDGACNCKVPIVSAVLSVTAGGKEGTPLRGEVGIPYVTSHQRLGQI